MWVAYAIWSALFKQNLRAGSLPTFRFRLTLWIVPPRLLARASRLFCPLHRKGESQRNMNGPRDFLLFHDDRRTFGTGVEKVLGHSIR
jgi:hypothetical protein